MISPPHLKKGDKIALLSTARKISKAELAPAIGLLETWGLVPVLGKTIDAEEHQFAGSDDLRRDDLQAMLDDTTIKAILCARGGYGTLRIIDHIDFSRFIKQPKWICGYSDITVLHAHMHSCCNLATIHSTMPINFPLDEKENEATRTLRAALFGETLRYEFENKTLGKNRLGTAQGELVGGNLSILYALCGSSSDLITDNKILFLEDLDEYLYHIDRMMLQLKRSGKLTHLAGLVIGGMSDMKDNAVPFGKTAEEIIWDAVKEFSFPVAFGFPAGHVHDNRALVFGQETTVIVEKNRALLKG